MIRRLFYKLISGVTLLTICGYHLQPIFAIDDMFQFQKQYLPEKIEFEKTRALCIFPFRQMEKNESSDYLQTGLPSVIYSELSKIEYVFDPEVLPEKIFHEFGKPPKNKKPKKSRGLSFNRKFLKELNTGKKELPFDKDPRFIKLRHKLIENALPPIEGSEFDVGKKNLCHYVLTGSFQKIGEDSLSVQVDIFERKSGTRESFNHSSSFRRSYQEIGPLIDEISSYFTKIKNTKITVKTGKTEGILAYLDGIYIGKTPVIEKKVPPGKHKLSFIKEGFISSEYNIELIPNTHSKFDVDIQKIPLDGKISVTSVPEGADVYLGLTHLGKTPIKNMPVPLGTNRIRISMENYIDYFTGVNIRKGNPVVLDTELKPGKTIPYYKNQFNLFIDYTYFDFAIYSFYSVLLFYGSYGYHDIMVNRTRDQLRTEVFTDRLTLLGFFSEISSQTEASALAFTTQLFYEDLKIESNERKVQKYKNIRNASAVAGATMFLMGIGFYYLGYSEESLNFGFSIEPSKFNTGNAEVNSKFRFNFYF